jgi:hypothetical protein
MPPVPLDEGYPGRRRVGPFWIEEGPGLVVAGGVILLLFVALFVLAFIFRPS